MSNDCDCSFIVEKDWQKLERFIKKVPKGTKSSTVNAEEYNIDGVEYKVFWEGEYTQRKVYQAYKKINGEWEQIGEDDIPYAEDCKWSLKQGCKKFEAVKWQNTFDTGKPDYDITIDWVAIKEAIGSFPRVKYGVCLAEGQESIMVSFTSAWGFPSQIIDYLDSLDITWQGGESEPAMEVYDDELGNDDFGIRLVRVRYCNGCGLELDEKDRKCPNCGSDEDIMDYEQLELDPEVAEVYEGGSENA